MSQPPNIKTEPITPAASAVPVQRTKKRASSPPPEMPKPLEEAPQIKVERSTSPLVRRRLELQHINNGRLMGGGENGDVPETVKRAKKERSPKTTRERTAPNDEAPKLRATLKKYEETVEQLLQKLKSDQKTYKAAVRELQQSNVDLRDELSSLQNTVMELSAQRDVEQELVTTLRGDNTTLGDKNGQLTEDLSKIVDQIQHSDEVIEEMRRKLTERDTEMGNLTTEKEYLVQQLEGTRRLSRSMISLDAFAPAEGGRRGSGCAGESGFLGGIFCPQHRMGSTNRLFVFAFLLCLGVGFFFQNLRPTEAINPAGDCDYEIYDLM